MQCFNTLVSYYINELEKTSYISYITLHSTNLKQLQCENKKLYKLISNKKRNKNEDSYTVSVINL